MKTETNETEMVNDDLIQFHCDECEMDWEGYPDEEKCLGCGYVAEA